MHCEYILVGQHIYFGAHLWCFIWDWFTTLLCIRWRKLTIATLCQCILTVVSKAFCWVGVGWGKGGLWSKRTKSAPLCSWFCIVIKAAFVWVPEHAICLELEKLLWCPRLNTLWINGYNYTQLFGCCKMRYEKLVTHVGWHASALSLLKSREQHYVKENNNSSIPTAGLCFADAEFYVDSTGNPKPMSQASQSPSDCHRLIMFHFLPSVKQNNFQGSTASAWTRTVEVMELEISKMRQDCGSQSYFSCKKQTNKQTI